MIAKHIAMKSIRKSRFSELVDYLLDEQDKLTRVGQVSVTNCFDDDPQMVAIEVEATQRKNSRAKGDKTFHLIVSWRPGERPTPDAVRDVEETICARLGYGEHQRISVVHDDTDNFHIHIAINKVHPTRHTYHEPHQFKRTLLKVCDELEDRHGFQKDNHGAEVRKTRAENRAADMERNTGRESLIGWVKRECAAQLTAAATWSEFHSVLQSHGLHIQERGNGLVIGDGNGVYARASAVDRRLSKAQLEKRLGSLAAPALPIATPAKLYQKAPVAPVDSKALFARYLASQDERDTKRRAFVAKETAQLRSAIDLAAKQWRAKRLIIKGVVRGPLLKRANYAIAKKVFEQDVTRLRAEHQRTMATARATFRRRSWYEFLQDEAKAGNREALACLQRRPGAAPLIAGLRVDTVTKRGVVTYRVGNAGMRDDGRRFILTMEPDATAARVALIRTVQRSGPAVAVTGSDAFKNRLVEVAVSSRLPLTFTNGDLEARRRALMEALHVRTHPAAQPERSGAGHDRAAGAGRAVGAGRAAGAGRPTGAGRAAAPGPGLSDHQHNVADLGGIGQKPPPQRRHRLHELPKLGMVRIAGRTEVLLPSHVPIGVDQQRAATTDALRRNVSGERGIAPPVLDAADRFIAERNSKRATLSDVLQHRRHTAADVGPLALAGVRQVDGKSLALLRKDDCILVVPITDYAASRLRTTSIGNTVHLQANGEVRLKTRSRKR